MSQGENWDELAYQAWPILCSAAKRKQPMFYGELGKELRIHHRPVRLVLDRIQSHCLSAELPPLTILVVDKSKGKPGTGFVAHGSREDVYGYDWDSVRNPFLEKALIEAVLINPEKTRDVYKKVSEDRGQEQMIFREALLKAYSGKCAFTGLSFPEGLDACHIIPWKDADDDERLDPRNGILLNKFHHGLFDRGVMTVRPDYTIEYCGKKSKNECSEIERDMVIDLSGKKMAVPKVRKHKPLPEYIARHNEMLKRVY